MKEMNVTFPLTEKNVKLSLYIKRKIWHMYIFFVQATCYIFPHVFALCVCFLISFLSIRRLFEVLESSCTGCMYLKYFYYK